MSGALAAFLDAAARWRVAVTGRAQPYHQILEIIAQLASGDDTAWLDRRFAAAWQGRRFENYFERPLLLLGALRFDALSRGPAHPLHAAIASSAVDLRVVTREAVVAALDEAAVWEAIRDRYVQTNETSRAVAWTWPAFLAGAEAGERPLVLCEVGCAAGLNLVAETLPAPWVYADETRVHRPIPVVTSPQVVRRMGFDRRPLDVRDPDALRWMRACIWPGEPARLARFEASVARLLEQQPVLEAVHASDVPPRVQSIARDAPSQALVLVYQTVVRDYFDEETSRVYTEGMRDLMPGWPGRLIWVELELTHRPDEHPGRLAAITAHVADARGDVHDLVLGKTSYHPSDIAVDDSQVSRFVSLCASRRREA